jgi:hypothetical protein
MTTSIDFLPGLRLTRSMALCVLLCAFQGLAQAQEPSVSFLQTLRPTFEDMFPNGVPPDGFPPELSFGQRLTVHGNTALIAVTHFRDSTGPVGVYTPDASGQWQRTATLDAPDRQPGDGFGFAMALDDRVALIASTKGVHVYRRDSASFTLIQVLPSTATRVLTTGPIWNRWIFIPVFENGGVHHVRLYRFTPRGLVFVQQVRSDGGPTVSQGWVFTPAVDNGEGRLRAYLLAPWGLVFVQGLRSDGPPDDGFPGSVGISHGTLVIGAANDDQGRGAAYVFERVNGVFWKKRQKLIAMNGAPGDAFGQSIAVTNGAIVIGSTKVKIPVTEPGSSCGGEALIPFYTGSVWVFRKAPGRLWDERQVIPAPLCIFDFSAGLIVSGNWIVASYPGTGRTGYNPAANVYHADESGDYVEVGSVTGPRVEDLNLALSGRTLFAGHADESNFDFPNIGSVDVYLLNEAAPQAQ